MMVFNFRNIRHFQSYDSIMTLIYNRRRIIRGRIVRGRIVPGRIVRKPTSHLVTCSYIAEPIKVHPNILFPKFHLLFEM